MNFNIKIIRHSRPLVEIDAFKLNPRKITFLFGESGIGKSILSKAVYGLIDPKQLSVTINGLSNDQYRQLPETQQIRRNGFFVFQEPSTHLNPLIRLEDQLREGSISGKAGEAGILNRLWDGEKDPAIQRILSVYPKPYRPSGGEKQRILLAMAFKKIDKFIASQPNVENQLFVFDEPTGSLDNHFRDIFLDILLGRFRQCPFTSLLITHDYSIISEIYQNHADLKKFIDFKELYLDGDILKLRSFKPEAYLGWLNEIRNNPPFRATDETELMTLKGGYEVFNRKMIISQDRSSKDYGSLQVHRGEIIYLKAASGVGKTTLAKVVMGLIPAGQLELLIGNWRFSAETPRRAWRTNIWGKKIGMVFQHADEALNLQSTVEDAFAGLPTAKPLGREAIVEHLRSLFDIEINDAFLKKQIKLLSGGQKQRLNILRTLVLDTDILILDEPLNGLDFLSIKRIVKLLRQKCSAGKSILLISHNEEIFDSMIPKENVYFLQ